MSHSSGSETETSTEFIGSKCDEDVSTCHHLQSLIKCLQQPEQHSTSNSLLHDYHHILMSHLNRDHQSKEENDRSFAAIYEHLTAHIPCTQHMACPILQRHHRRRDNIVIASKQYSQQMYSDLRDTIHCHLLHSYDCGYRIKPSQWNTDEAETIIKLQSLMVKPRDEMRELCGDDRYMFDRFITNAAVAVADASDISPSTSKPLQTNRYEQTATDDDDDEYMQYMFGSRDSIDEVSDNQSDSDAYYDGSVPQHKSDNMSDAASDICGQTFWYWPYYQSNAWHVTPKYSHLKEELTHNRLHRIDRTVYDYVYRKACKLLSESEAIKSMRSSFTELALHYGVADDLPLNASNVMSVMLYTDYDGLSYNALKTFRKLSFFAESDEQQRLRHREYCHWMKLLRETVECYGAFMGECATTSYYHCMSDQVRLSSFTLQFGAPISMTPSLECGALFTDAKGVILELATCDIGDSVRVLNTAFFSSFPSQQERIAFVHRSPLALKLLSIRYLQRGENYVHFIRAIQLIDSVMNGGECVAETKSAEDEKQFEAAETLLQSVTRAENTTTTTSMDLLPPSYVVHMFDAYRSKKKRIEIELTSFSEYYKPLSAMFVDNRSKNLIYIDRVCRIFKNCEKITIDNDTRHISSRYLSMLLTMVININHDADVKLRCVKIERIQYDSTQFEAIVSKFENEKWQIKVKEETALQFGLYIAVATLSLTRVYEFDTLLPLHPQQPVRREYPEFTQHTKQPSVSRPKLTLQQSATEKSMEFDEDSETMCDLEDMQMIQ